MKPKILITVVMTLIGVYMATPRGIRNNNPLNLREDIHGGDAWDGEALLDWDSSFEEFKSPKWGIRAGAKTLRNYQRLHGLYTVNGIISRFAPSIENNTTSYVNHVASKLGVHADQAINLDDKATLTQLVNVIIKHENGINPYTEETISDAIDMALA